MSTHPLPRLVETFLSPVARLPPPLLLEPAGLAKFAATGGGNVYLRRFPQTAEWWSTAYGIQVVSSDNNTLVPIKEWLDTMGVKPTNRSAHNLATWKKLGLPGCSKYPLARRAPLTIWDVIGKTPLKPDSPLYVKSTDRTFLPVDKEWITLTPIKAKSVFAAGMTNAEIVVAAVGLALTLTLTSDSGFSPLPMFFRPSSCGSVASVSAQRELSVPCNAYSISG
ncbi:hypothetical protein NFJ02_14g17400 [Pycnococcus provasolii]